MNASSFQSIMPELGPATTENQNFRPASFTAISNNICGVSELTRRVGVLCFYIGRKNPPAVEIALRRLDGHIARGHPPFYEVAFADSYSRINPLVRRFHHLFEVFIGQEPRGDIPMAPILALRAVSGSRARVNEILQ